MQRIKNILPNTYQKVIVASTLLLLRKSGPVIYLLKKNNYIKSGDQSQPDDNS